LISPAHFINKLVVFFDPDKATYWHTITRNTLNEKPTKVGRYYLNFESKLDYPEKIDSNGIPLYRFPGEAYFYHPIVICQYALGIFEHLYQSGYSNTELKDKFLTQVEWLVNNAVETPYGKVWYWDFNIPDYGIYKPWYSALSQGEAASVLSRAALITGDEKYLILAEDAIKSFNVPVKDGGLLNYFNNLPIYEEYPSPKRTVGNLCGFMFTLFGLYDLTLTNKNSLAGPLFDQGIQSLKKLLQFYDTGYWSRYYVFDYPNKYVASFTYHSLQFEQLKSLFLITGEKTFLDYSEKWEAYSHNYFNKTKALAQKIFYAKNFK
jgi:heparosan-N-sulfate-glucuronate 5-epimerase